MDIEHSLFKVNQEKLMELFSSHAGEDGMLNYSGMDSLTQNMGIHPVVFK